MEVTIAPVGAAVKKVVIYAHNSTYIRGIQFYDSNKACLLEAGVCEGKTKEIILEDNERLIGVKARQYGFRENTCLSDFKFLTGKQK